MRYVLARAEQDYLDKSYRFYVTDMLKAYLAPNAPRYADITRHTYAKEETRTSEEIIRGIREKLGGS